MSMAAGRRVVAGVGCLGLLAVAGCGGPAVEQAAARSTSTVSTTTTTTLAPIPPAPLTGLPQPTATQLADPAVVVKIDNVVGALPQTGINQADVVYEEMVEGGLTRLAAIFQSDYPAKVGPVRSGRLTDEGIADDLNHPVYVFSGTNADFLPILDSQPVTPVNDNNEPNQFYRDGPNEEPHNLYADVVSLAALSTTHTAPSPLFTYLAKGAQFGGAGVTPATQISINFPAASVVWAYNATAGTWARTQNGSADVDTSGQQVTAANVVVLFVPYVTSGIADESGVSTPIPEGELTGTGTAWFLSDGQIVQGAWSRSSLTSVATYSDSSGAPISFTPGQTWVELVPTGTTPTVTP